MQSQFLIINSKDRSAGTPSNFNYTMKYYGTNRVSAYRINKITIPFSWYPIVNQSFTVQYGATDYIIPVDAGQWSAVQLAANIQREFDSAIGAGIMTCAWVPGRNVFAIDSTTITTFILKFDVGDPLSPPPANRYQNIGVMMGFKSVGGLPTYGAAALQKISVYAVNLSGTPNVYVKSQSLQIYLSSFFNKVADNVIQSVPVNSNAGDFIVWQNSVPTTFTANNSNPFSCFDFQLVDEWGNYLDMRNSDWVLELQIFFSQ